MGVCGAVRRPAGADRFHQHLAAGDQRHVQAALSQFDGQLTSGGPAAHHHGLAPDLVRVQVGLHGGHVIGFWGAGRIQVPLPSPHSHEDCVRGGLLQMVRLCRRAGHYLDPQSGQALDHMVVPAADVRLVRCVVGVAQDAAQLPLRLIQRHMVPGPRGIFRGGQASDAAAHHDHPFGVGGAG